MAKNQYFHESCAPDVDGIKVMTTKYDGKCYECQNEYSIGDSIAIIFGDEKPARKSGSSGKSDTDITSLKTRVTKLEQDYAALADVSNRQSKLIDKLSERVKALESSAF